MESLTLTTTTTATTNTSKFRFSIPCYKNPKIYKNLPFNHKRHRKFVSFAAKDDASFDSYDQMEIKFGRLIGEDPKLTLAKILGRKTFPEMSSLEIEKLYNKKGLKAFNDIEELPFDVSDVRKKPNDSLDGLNLTRPVPKNGVKFEKNESSDGLNLTRPVPKKGVKFETNDKPVVPEVKRPSQPLAKAPSNPVPSVVPNVKLRKPTTFNDDDGLTTMIPRPNFAYKVNKEEEEDRLTDMTMVRKPAPYVQKEETEVVDDESESQSQSQSEIQTDASLLQKPEIAPSLQQEETEVVDNESKSQSQSEIQTDASLLQKPAIAPSLQKDETEVVDNDSQSQSESQTDVSLLQKPGIEVNQDFRDQNEPSAEIDELKNSSRSVDLAFEIEKEDNNSTGSQPSEQTETGFAERGSVPDIAAALRGPPKRLDQPVKDASKIEKPVSSPTNTVPTSPMRDSETLPTTPLLKGREDADWKRAQDLMKAEGREEVELINSSTRGFVASFGSLIGFLPYRNLATKWKYLAFESWLRKKGLDPAMYRQSLGVIGGYDATSKSTPKSTVDVKKIEGEISPDMKLEDLLAIYDQEKLKYLSSFVGQKVKVNVVLADKETNRLIFSGKPKEKDESIERKKNLMAKLNVGDVVKCCIKKITYYGIFVEVEGVPALIHQTEVSWDDTLDIISHFKIGQVVEAKVHQLDFSLERIFLSLKDITPDPLIETLEAVVGDQANLDGRLEAAQPDEEWTEVESLVKELQQYQGVDRVKKGGFFLSPGLAPTFQVYMASVVDNEYKLLARAGNKVQEVIVETSMGKEEMKSAILTCANRVE
ncbi:putative nucleic acid-binding, RNA-binding domain, S1 [Helianthus annuus]|nr:putative nucleic acid-binding, RNA-binding domain, S1 [Helianthus annuus]KAJ0777650.1 putative nucleic acid-binding, RNA-binding domain, S1 [Helianthus annuus]KAJ0786675.1 putative nucleic acid-binding, RNA-binding domain, S1 [Helianthus annuus]